MKYFFISYFLVAVTIVALAGFRGHKFEKPPIEIFDDMDSQAKVKYQQPNNFFADGHGMRKPVAGTMPVGYEVPSKPAHEGYEAQTIEFTHGKGYYYTGLEGNFFGDGFPKEITVDEKFLDRGKERYDIHCAVCHGTSGNGKGIVTKYSPVVPADLTGPGFGDPSNAAYRPDGKLFYAITHGWNQMGGYGANITISDRWAIVAYLRTLDFAAQNPATK